MEQKVIITDKESSINDWLSRGWEVVSVTAQHVSTAASYDGASFGKFCFVIQKQS